MFLSACKRLQFPAESIPVLEDCLQKIEALAAPELSAVCRYLIAPEEGDCLQYMQRISDKTGIHRFTTDLVALVYAIRDLQQVYAAKGLPEQLLWDSMEDLRYKLYECKQVYGFWGTAAGSWHRRFYWLQLFKLGRLEFEKITWRWDATGAGIQKDDPVINIHIPSCGPLTPALVEDSLARAAAFYAKDFPEGPIPFVCHSWLLYTPVCEQVFAEGSNLKAFFRRFTAVEDHPDPLNKNFWRIFGIEYSENALDIAPADTKLRRDLLAFLRAGNCMGNGLAMLWYPAKNQ